MVKVHYPELFHDDPTQFARFTTLSLRTFELTDFLVKIAKLEKAPGNFQGTITYHDSCSGLRELDVYKQPRQLLATVPDISVNFKRQVTVKLADVRRQNALSRLQSRFVGGRKAWVWMALHPKIYASMTKTHAKKYWENCPVTF